jgi:hypothetical protein
MHVEGDKKVFICWLGFGVGRLALVQDMTESLTQ